MHTHTIMQSLTQPRQTPSDSSQALSSCTRLVHLPSLGNPASVFIILCSQNCLMWPWGPPSTMRLEFLASEAATASLA